MPVQHSPPSKKTRSQGNPASLTPTVMVPLDRTPSVHQLSENLDRGPPMEGAAPSRRGGMKSRISRSFSVILGGYPAGAPKASEAANLAHSNQPLVSQAEPNFLKMMEKMTQFMEKLT
ncbi:hypothetical protein O181_076338 [Austropuccinia psidii MF-1]|uniref:Uncharacterized protein n=1 Tax=Austropuccinia psidii MF-1 TaxID=1389203 RepID=A0A9Q3FER9_9BASI|nr:hypothetical protein [Austropuccinia psidii MF-1]